jgi:hypothetical protein
MIENRKILNGQVYQFEMRFFIKRPFMKLQYIEFMHPPLSKISINDKTEVTILEMENYLFATEAKPLRGIFLHSDCEELQADIHTLQESFDKWLLCFHIEKCKAMIENRKILNGIFILALL